jgi:phage terminase small subunit
MPPPGILPKFTPKQKQFIKEYLIDKNATQAAIRAGYSKHTAKDMGCQNLAKPAIQEHIKRGLEKLRYKAQISSERVLEEEKCLSMADPGELLSKEGTLIPVNELPEHVRRSIKSFVADELPRVNGEPQRYRWKYKFWDKGRSLERLGKHLGLFEADNEQRHIIVLQAPPARKEDRVIEAQSRPKLIEDKRSVDV